jgi:hypothetical protein
MIHEDKKIHTQYREAGLHVFPVNDEKRPAVPFGTSWTPNNKEGKPCTPDKWVFSGSIGMGCGTISGNIEVLDVDAKNDSNLIEKLEQRLNEYEVYLPDNLVIQTTVNGGLHFIYRTHEVEGNKQLAKNSKGEVTLETRAENGYIVIAPTQGYEIKQGTLTDIPYFTKEQRDNLFTACRSLNEYWPEQKAPNTKTFTSTIDGLPPWDDYDTRGDEMELLQRLGFTYYKTVGENDHYTREGRTKVTSATWHRSKRIFYPFSSSIPLEQKGYTLSAVMAYLEFNGDFTATARKLSAMGYGERKKDTKTTESKEEPSELPTRDQLRMTFRYQRKNINPSILFNGQKAIYPGEIMAIVGLPGQGKSAGCEGITSSHLSGKEHLGFTVNSTGKSVLVCDTERPPDNVSTSYTNIGNRIGADVVMDTNGEIARLVYLYMAELGKVETLKAVLEREVSTGEFELIVLDGILDFSRSMNDDIDSTEVVKWVRALAVKYNCAVVLTIHPNKGSEVIAGHLGAFLYRWCRAILFIRPVKGNKAVKEITCEPEMAKLSHGDIASLEPVYIAWDDYHKMLMRTDYTPPEVRGQEDRMAGAFGVILANGIRYRYNELVRKLEDIGVKTPTAKRWIKKADEKGILNTTGGIYSLKTNNENGITI